MGTPLRLPQKLSAAPVITSVENKCTCCLLHPIGNESSAWPIGNESSAWLPSSPSPTLDSSCLPLLVKDAIHMGIVDTRKISFQVDSASPKHTGSLIKWNEWVRAMATEKKFCRRWEQAGITDAIVASSVAMDIMIDQEMMKALFGFWCSATNTFIFPWGEAGFTLEDSHIFTALPVRGSDLDRELTAKENGLKNRLIVEMEKILVLNREAQCAGMVTHNIWLEWFINEKDIDDELQHLGFLTYWLCKHVFTSAKPTLAALFGLAARLSLGDRISLAPAVVAKIYHDLNVMTTSIVSSQRNKEKGRGQELKASAPFGFLQCWVWERFESLRPNMYASIIQQSRVRIARWSGIQSKTGYDEAMKIFQDERCFTWRPYSHKLGNWAEPEWYNVESCIITMEAEKVPTFVYDFIAVVSCAFVKGLSAAGNVFSESYRPNRFARQFGFDQAIPGVNEACQNDYHDSAAIGVHVWIPGITRHGNPRRDYDKWWKSHGISCRETLIQHFKPNAPMQTSDLAVTENSEKDKPVLVDKNKFSKKRETEERNKHQSCTKKAHRNILQRLSSKCPSVGTSRDKKPDIINIHSDDEENLKTLNVPPVAPDDGTQIIGKNELALVKELDEFQRDGLMTYLEPSPEIEDSREMLSVKYKKDPYGQEAIDRFPNFFRLIPQQPHYEGLLKGQKIAEDMKQHIFLGQWYMLVRLMEEALCTNVRTDAVEIEQMFSKARMLEKNGFDVRHLIARLKFVQVSQRKIVKNRY